MAGLKTEAVLFLAARGTDRDRDAAKILARCDVEERHVTGPRGLGPQRDVLLRADHRTVSCAKSGDAAGRIENAITQTLGEGRLRTLQWVEESAGREPRPAGDSHARSDETLGPRPRFDPLPTRGHRPGEPIAHPRAPQRD